MKGITQVLQGKQYSKVRKPFPVEKFTPIYDTDKFNKQAKVFNRILTLITLTVFGAFALRIFVQ